MRNHNNTTHHRQKLQNLHYEVGNLTLAVIEIQKVLVETNGVTIEHPIKLAVLPEEDKPGDENAVQGDGGGEDGGEGGDSPPTVAMLRGAEPGQEDAVLENPDGGENGEEGHGGSGSSADGVGARRRLASVETREDRPEDRPAAVGKGGTVANRLRGNMKGSAREEGEDVSRP